MSDSVDTIRRSIRHVFSGTVLSRITGMLRDVAMAYAFGTHPSIAAFMVAFRFSHILRRIFGEGALQSAFIPEFESLRHENKERAFHFFGDLACSLSLFLIFLITLGCGILGFCLTTFSLSDNNREILQLTLFMLPSLLFICLFGINSALLQCEKKYFTSSFAPVAFNLVWIIAVFFSHSYPQEKAVVFLSCGVLIGCFFQWAVTLPEVWKTLKNPLANYKASFSCFFSPDIKIFIKTLSLGILGVSASQINNGIDAVFARYADLEGPAFLWYALRIEQLPLALFGIAVAGAIAPPLARAIKADQTENYHHFLDYAINKTWNLMLPCSFLLFAVGDLFVALLFNRGDFDHQSTIGTSYCLWGYTLGLLPSALILVLGPASYAKKNYKLPATASFLGLVLNVVFNTLFIHVLGLGSVSVAIATSLSAWINFFFLSHQLNSSCFSLRRFYLLATSLFSFWIISTLRSMIGIDLLQLTVENSINSLLFLSIYTVTLSFLFYFIYFSFNIKFLRQQKTTP